MGLVVSLSRDREGGQMTVADFAPVDPRDETLSDRQTSRVPLDDSDVPRE
jgi:hypothetical protein